MPPRPHATQSALAVLAGLSLLAAGPLAGPVQARPAGAASANPGFNVANLDRKVSPQADFYRFAIGGWQAAHPIPAEYSEWGSFEQLANKNQEALRGILDEAALSRHGRPGSNEQKIGDFYASFMDTAAIEAAGLRPLQAELDRLAAIHDRTSLIAAIGHLQTLGAKAVFGFGSALDFKDSTRVIGEAGQGGLGMPDRDYYTKDDARSKELRAAYVRHVARMFELAGDSQDAAAKGAQMVMALETALANASMTKVAQRDPNAVYHKMTRAELAALTPGFAWQTYFKAIGCKDLEALNIAQPEFFRAMDGLLATVPLTDWQTYLRWKLLDRTASGLPDAFVQEDFAFSRLLSGAKAMQPRWKRGVRITDRNLGEALGQIYAHKYFPPAAKARVKQMVTNMLAVLREDLKTLDWMGPETRRAATAKLDAFTVKIGYPDKWRNYGALRVDRVSYLGNVLRATAFESQRDLDKIGRPVDRTRMGDVPADRERLLRSDDE